VSVRTSQEVKGPKRSRLWKRRDSYFVFENIFSHYSNIFWIQYSFFSMFNATTGEDSSFESDIVIDSTLPLESIWRVEENGKVLKISKIFHGNSACLFNDGELSA